MRLFAILSLLVAAGAADAAWKPDPENAIEAASGEAIADIRERIERSRSFFDDAYGMAVYPSVTRIGFGFGGAAGKGILIEGDEVIGTTRYWQFTSGIQAGARNFSMVILFRDKQALDYFKQGKAQFMGQAGLAAGTKGIAGTPAYNDGVVVFTVTRLGLMAEFTVSGAWFTFRPIADGHGSDL